MKKFFKFKENKTNYKKEIIGGLTIFATMSYIIVVNPAILEAAGIPKDASMVATILAAVFGSVFLGLYANKPFAVAPYMGANAFIAYTVVQQLGYSWQTAMGGIFIGGILYTIATLLKLRTWLSKAMPHSVKSGIAAGIGLFIAFIGLIDSGIVKLGNSSTPVQMADLGTPEVHMSLFAFLLITILYIKKVPGSILLGIILSTLIAFFFGLAHLPENIMSMPPSIAPTFLQLDIQGALSVGFLSVILTLFIVDFVDTIASVVALGMSCGLGDKNGDIPDVEKPMLADALATIIASLLGTTTNGIYIESATGIQAGARTGFAAIVVALAFASALFFAPLITSVPVYAYAPALILIGATMLSPLKNINYTDLTEIIPAAVIIFLMIYTIDIGIGITAGLILYPILKAVTGRIKEVSSGMWVFFVFSLLFYIIKP